MSDVEIAAKFHTFCPAVEIRGGVGENADWEYRVYSATEPVVYI